MTFKRGQWVHITYGSETIDGMILLASPNNKSLMLGFSGPLMASPNGGVFVGSMPVLLDEHGDYRDLVENELVTIEPREN